MPRKKKKAAHGVARLCRCKLNESDEWFSDPENYCSMCRRSAGEVLRRLNLETVKTRRLRSGVPDNFRPAKGRPRPRLA